MDKQKLAEKIVHSLQKEVENLHEEYKRVSQEAIQAPSFMESQHDTTKQELSYEATRIQKRAGVLEHTIKQVSSFIPTMQKNSQVELGAFVHVRAHQENGIPQVSKDSTMQFLILPFGEGEKVDSTLVLSPQSPIFREMHEKRVGEIFPFRGKTYTIESIE